MTISKLIESRAIGLLTRFTEYCENNGMDPLTGRIVGPVNQSAGGNELIVSQSIASVGSAYIPGSLIDASVSMDAVVGWLDGHCRQTGMSLNTAKCYRRWLASYFEAIEHPRALLVRNWVPPMSREATLIADETDAAYLAGKAEGVELAKNDIDDDDLIGNSRYLTCLDRAWYTKLIEQLLDCTPSGSQRYIFGPQSALMFTVSMMTGLRPMEWPSARYLESHFDPQTKMTLGPVLEVHTLKQSKRREDNPLRDKRYLVLDRWPEGQRAQLRAFVELIQSEVSDFDSFYGKVRMTIGRAWRRAQKRGSKESTTGDNDGVAAGTAAEFADDNGIGAGIDVNAMLAELSGAAGTDMNLGGDSRSVSVYTARHIFAEEIRREGDRTRFELAALLGHSLLTNTVYYGPRRADCDRDFDFILPRPWPGDAADIELWDHKVNPLRINYAQGDLFSASAQATAKARASS